MTKGKKENFENDPSGPSTPPGVFVTKGMQITMPSFSISIGKDGEAKCEPVHIHTGLDLCPYWLNIAYDHLISTEMANDRLMAANESQNDEAIAVALADEFTSGMQAIMASVTAIDAYYAGIRERIEISQDLIQVWREKKTARYAQVSETLRIAFKIKDKPFSQLRKILKEMYRFRDTAVHPPSGATAPALYPELNKVTDWRYSFFRYYNAKAIVGESLSVIMQTANQPHKDKFQTLESYCDSLRSNLEPLQNLWAERY